MMIKNFDKFVIVEMFIMIKLQTYDRQNEFSEEVTTYCQYHFKTTFHCHPCKSQICADWSPYLILKLLRFVSHGDIGHVMPRHFHATYGWRLFIGPRQLKFLKSDNRYYKTSQLLNSILFSNLFFKGYKSDKSSRQLYSPYLDYNLSCSLKLAI